MTSELQKESDKAFQKWNNKVFVKHPNFIQDEAMRGLALQACLEHFASRLEINEGDRYEQTGED